MAGTNSLRLLKSARDWGLGTRKSLVFAYACHPERSEGSAAGFSAQPQKQIPRCAWDDNCFYPSPESRVLFSSRRLIVPSPARDVGGVE